MAAAELKTERARATNISNPSNLLLITLPIQSDLVDRVRNYSIMRKTAQKFSEISGVEVNRPIISQFSGMLTIPKKHFTPSPNLTIL